MLRIVYHRSFRKSAAQLPKAIRQKLSRSIVLLGESPFHPLLHTKRLGGALSGFLSFRVTRDWRVTFQFIDADTIQLLRAKHRKDIYRP